jgi:acetoin utilization deacetylase AcuC-like enzyme
MILYDPTVPVSLLPYGIQIPVRDSRATKTIEALSRHPRIGPRRAHWLVDAFQESLSQADLLRVHSAAYVDRLYSEHLRDEIIATFELVDANGRYYRYAPETAERPLTDLFGRMLHKAAGTLACARLALDHGFCFYFAGGMHHAHRDHGSGFCLINDIVVAARRLQSEGTVRRVWVIDVDAHKGDGTAALTAGDDTIQTLSIHMAAGWPLDGPPLLADGSPNPSFTPSTIDIPIGAAENALYLERLEQGLRVLEQFAAPDLAIVVCGADPFEADELPSTRFLKLTLKQMLRRDQLVYTFLSQRSVPAAYLMAGGYGEQVWRVYAQFLIWVLLERGVGTAISDGPPSQPAFD